MAYEINKSTISCVNLHLNFKKFGSLEFGKCVGRIIEWHPRSETFIKQRQQLLGDEIEGEDSDIKSIHINE